MANEVLRLWSESAPYWEKHRKAIAAMFAPMSHALIEETAIAPGHRVLDIAGGVGDPSLEIADVCAPSGWVACTDAIPDMLAVARRRANDEGSANVHFVQCLGDWLPFRSNSFDAVVSRLGVMFFFDPLVGVREMLRVLKPQGRLSLAVWAGPQLNPFFTILPQVLARYVPMPPPDPEAPGAFRFAEKSKLAKLVAQAGAAQVQERMLAFQIEAPVALEDFTTMRCELSETLREKAKQLSTAQLAAVEREVREVGRSFFPNNRMSFPAQTLIVTGQK